LSALRDSGVVRSIDRKRRLGPRMECRAKISRESVGLVRLLKKAEG